MESGPIEASTENGIERELDVIVRTLRETMDDRGQARSLFLTGSAVTGEWAARLGEDGWHFFSDLDIGILRDTREPEVERELRDVLRQRVGALAEGREWRTPPEVNIAFFSPDEMASQAPKPGTLEMINRGRVVWGERSLRDHFPNLTVEDLTWEEAVRLLGNRVLELLAYPPGDLIEARDYYRIGKLFCDLATALLVPEGAYVSGYRERSRRLPALLNDRPLSPKLRRLRGRLLESVEFWTNFRIAPSVETLRGRYAIEPLGESGRALYGGIWCEARLLLEACLEALLPHRLLDRTGRPCPEGLSRTSGWGSWRQRMREWRWLAGYESEDRLHIWRRGFGVAFRLSPVEITYLIGFILFVRTVDGPPPCYLDDDLVQSLERWYPLPHAPWSTGEEVRGDLIRLWRYWLPRI